MNIKKIITEIKKDNLLVSPNIIIKLNIDIDKHFELLKEIAKYVKSDYLFTENINQILKLLLLYFAGQEEFISMYNKIYEREGTLQKGILLIGSVGSGKSLIFEIFKLYTSRILHKNSYQIFQSNDIIDGLNIQGKIYFNKFSYNRSNNNTLCPITCYIDDIGSRNEIVNYYGSEYNTIQELITIRYNIFTKYRKLTHLSTNLYPNKLKEIYGERLIDRMREMFNIIELNGTSFRK